MVNSNINEKIVEKLYSLQDKKFGEFNAKLVNNIDNESIYCVIVRIKANWESLARN